MHEQGYEPEAANYIGQLVFGDDTQGHPPVFEWYRKKQEGPVEQRRTDDGAYQYRGAERPADSIFLLWLSERYCASLPQRLRQVEALVSPLSAPGGSRTDSVLIGPAFSSCLAKLAAASGGDTGEAAPRNRLVLSPSATIPAAYMAGLVDEQGADAEARLVATLERKYGFKFVRTVVSDEPLVSALADEIVMRRYFDPENDFIAVISESDTEYGRTMPKILEARLPRLGFAAVCTRVADVGGDDGRIDYGIRQLVVLSAHPICGVTT